MSSLNQSGESMKLPTELLTNQNKLGRNLIDMNNIHSYSSRPLHQSCAYKAFLSGSADAGKVGV